MELPDLGQHCSVADCKLLNFLPLKCSCGKYLCQDHFFDHGIKCQVLIQDFQLTNYSNKVSTDSYKCSQNDCKNVSLFAFECKKCGKHFCIDHRYHLPCYDLTGTSAKLMANSNTNDKFERAYELVDKKINAQLALAMEKTSSVKTANKINLMRLKSRAKGEQNIPTIDRLYFVIFYKSKSSAVAETTPIYLSQSWSLGRCIDSVAKLCNIQNRNNELNAEQLRFFKKENCELIENTLSKSLSSLVAAGVILNGDSIILDYIDSKNNPKNVDLFV